MGRTGPFTCFKEGCSTAMSPRRPLSEMARACPLGVWALLLGLAGLLAWCAGDPAQAAAWFQSPASPLRPGSLAGPPGLLPAPGRAVQASFWVAGLALATVVGVALLLHWTWGPSPTSEEEGRGEGAP
jgi:ferric-dicitrate binding protein FerR (iron transport regulator)